MGVNEVNNSVLTSMSRILPCACQQKTLTFMSTQLTCMSARMQPGAIKLSHMDVIGFDMGVNGVNHSF